jgi:hypothetical protein
MGTTRVFQTMLNEFLPNDLFKEELIKRDWILQNVEMDNSWLGGTLVVPFKGAGASSVAFGALTSSTDIAQDQYVRGQVTTQPEAWGTLYFDHRDLMEHSKVSVQNFLKMLPDQVDEFIDYMKMVVSLSFLNGTYFAKATADGDASGNLTVDRIERFVIGQKVSIDDDNSSPVTGYVRTISMDTNVVTFYDARTAGSVVNLSTYTVAQNARCYFDGSQSSGFTSLKQSLLSLANGGSTNLYGVAKTAWPYLQAINVSGASSTATTLLQDIFDAYVTIRNKGKGNPEKVLMSYRNFGYVMTILEAGKGAYHIDQTSMKVNAYGWQEISVFGPKGRVTLVAIQEMDDDACFFLDLRALKIYSNGGFRKRSSPDGIEYFEQRATTGYSYLVDVCFFGDLVLQRPSYCGILHSIP